MCPSSSEEMHKLWLIHMEEYYVTFGGKELNSHIVAWKMHETEWDLEHNVIYVKFSSHTHKTRLSVSEDTWLFLVFQGKNGCSLLRMKRIRTKKKNKYKRRGNGVANGYNSLITYQHNTKYVTLILLFQTY